jgi:hypothetical protein
MPLVQIVATAESQTANTMRMVRAFAPKGSPIVHHYQLDPGKTQYYKLPEGTLEVKTSSVTASEGAEASFVVADETEHWKPSNAGPDLAATLEDNLAKSGSRMLETSNAWEPGAETVAEATWGSWLLQEEGLWSPDAGRILYDARIAPPTTEVSEPAAWRSALEFIYDDCDWRRRSDGAIDIESIMRRVLSRRAKLDDSKRKYLNWPTAAQDAWTTLEAWNRMRDPQPVEKSDEVVLFFDGSRSRDATGLVGCRLDDGYVFVLGGWEPDQRDPNDTIDAGRVDLTVRQAFAELNVVAFFADVREWESFVLTDWPVEFADRLVVHSAPNARPPQSIAWDMRGHAYEFAKACEAAQAEITEGAFRHDGNDMLARHVANARQRPYRDAVSIRKESPVSRAKIDLAVCMVGARMVRRLVLASGKRKKAGSLW